VPADQDIRPLRHNLLVESLDVVHSRYIFVKRTQRPLRGTVLRAGPGHYQKCYDHQDKHKRSRMWDSKHFRPIEVKVGDIIELGFTYVEGIEYEYAFEQFYWGDKLVFWCTENDVLGIVPAELDDGRIAQRA
jgi:hypothetical protein